MLRTRENGTCTFDINRSHFNARKKSTELNVKKFRMFHCLPREMNSISRKHVRTYVSFSRFHYCENNRSSQFTRLYVYISEIWTRQSTGGTGFSELRWLIKTARRISLRQPRCYWSEAINRLIRGLLDSSNFRKPIDRATKVSRFCYNGKRRGRSFYREATHLRAAFIQNVAGS